MLLCFMLFSVSDTFDKPSLSGNQPVTVNSITTLGQTLDSWGWDVQSGRLSHGGTTLGSYPPLGTGIKSSSPRDQSKGPV